MLDSGKELLDVVDENDHVIGSQIREVVHAQGLLHRECGVWFYTPEMEIIMQKRSPTKKSNPNLLAATVAGHVPSGMSYMEAALMETFEETGLKLKPDDLKLGGRYCTHEKTNNHLTVCYVHLYQGDTGELKVEEGAAVGFFAWPIRKLLQLTETEKTLFLPSLPIYLPLFEKILSGNI
jgi:isopentenyldiphosphate isomerase